MSKAKYYAIAAVVVCCAIGGLYYVFSSRTAHVTGAEKTVRSSKMDPAAPADQHNSRATEVAGKAKADVDSSVRSGSTAAMPADSGTRQAQAQTQSNFERQFVKSSPDGKMQMVDGGMTGSVLSKGFKDAIQTLQQQAYTDSTVTDLTASYKSAIAQQLTEAAPSAKLSDFACGVQMCFGQIDTGSDSSNWQDWLKKFNADSRTQSWVFMEYDITMPDGTMQRRFAISIDPKVNALNSPPKS